METKYMKEVKETKQANKVKEEKQAYGLYNSKQTMKSKQTKEAEKTEQKSGYRSRIYRSYLALFTYKPRPTVQYITVQKSTVQYIPVLVYSTVSTVQYSTVQLVVNTHNDRTLLEVKTVELMFLYPV